MKRFLIWGVSLGCLGTTALALVLAPGPLAGWFGAAFRGNLVRWLPHLPLVLLALFGLWGSHLRQGKVVLLALHLGCAHACMTFPMVPVGSCPESLREGLGVFVPWAFPLLVSWPETSLRRLGGWARLGAVLSLWLGALVWGWSPASGARWSVHLAQVPGGVRGLSALLALLAIWGLPPADERGLRVSWSLALVSLWLALCQGEPWWPASVHGAPWPVFLSLGSLFLLGGLYGLTWRRAYLDGLTGLPGRRAFDESLRRLGRRYAIAMVDVDHFKRFNDRYGHQVGDQVLRFIGTRLKRVHWGRAFRYGGEEFALILCARGVQGALTILEGLRLSIEASRLTIRGPDRPQRKPRRRARPRGGRQAVGVTVSIGVAQRSRAHSTPQAVLRAADEALYRAKRGGRNRVEAERRKRPR